MAKVAFRKSGSLLLEKDYRHLKAVLGNEVQTTKVKHGPLHP